MVLFLRSFPRNQTGTMDLIKEKMEDRKTKQLDINQYIQNNGGGWDGVSCG